MFTDPWPKESQWQSTPLVDDFHPDPSYPQGHFYECMYMGGYVGCSLIQDSEVLREYESFCGSSVGSPFTSPILKRLITYKGDTPYKNNGLDPVERISYSQWDRSSRQTLQRRCWNSRSQPLNLLSPSTLFSVISTLSYNLFTYRPHSIWEIYQW